jgi:putative SOS response-associated peptidase YedK
MCGRFTLYASPKAIAEVFGVAEPLYVQHHYNIALTQSVAVVREQPETHQRELALLHWELIPFWADDPSIGNRMINSRSETAAKKPAFRRAFRSRHCLVVADGFYEWQKMDGKKQKQPFFIRMKNSRPFGMAGLWERWDKEGDPIESCTILTTEANELMRPIHDRMPVIIPPDQFDNWLDPGAHDEKQQAGLLRPFSSSAMTAYPISTKVNNPRNDVAGCIEPLQEGGEHATR